MRKLIIALFALLLAAPAAAQQFPTVHDRTVIGRIGTGSGSGPSQAIPFADLFANLISGSGVPNAVLVTDGSGNGAFSTTLPSGLVIPSPNLTGSIKSPFGNNLPIFGGGNGANLQAGTTTGNTTKVATASGSFIATNCLTTDVNHNIIDNTMPCGTGTNTASSQDFLAGTNFTAGTTTSLTVSSAPISAANSVVTFDGVVQSHNTWTLLGSTFTFSAAIPLNTQVVEIGWLSTTVLPTFVTSFGGATGALTAGTGVTINGQTINVNIGSVDNLLPNVQWQMITGDVVNVKQNATGTGPQTPASCTSFLTTNANPVFTCPGSTQQIKVGDIVVVATSASFTTAAYDAFWGFSGGGYISCNAGTVACTATFGSAGGCSPGSGGTANSCYIMGARVIAVVPNTSITLQGNFIGVSPTVSTAAALYPIARTSGGLNIGPDGWSITTSMTSFPDDFSAHSYPGAIRVLGTRGGATGTESLTWTVPANQVGRFQGMTMSCGVAANQTVQGGGATWNISINDSSGTTSSPSGTGVGLGGYQFEPVTRTIAANATSVSVSLNKLGNNGDVIYWALPTCVFSPVIVQSQLHQNSNEYISAQGHCNPPLLTPLILQFNNPVGTLWGWTDLDLEAISLGCYHKSLGGVMAKIEWTTTSVGSTLITTNDNTFSSFGPQAYTNVSGVGNMGGPSLQRLTSQGTFGMVSNVHNLIPTSGTWDWWDGVASMPNPVH